MTRTRTHIHKQVIVRLDEADVKVNRANNKFFTIEEVTSALLDKYEVFHVKKPYSSGHAEKKIRSEWETLLGPERVLMLQDPKACVDTILGKEKTGTRRINMLLIS